MKIFIYRNNTGYYVAHILENNQFMLGFTAYGALENLCRNYHLGEMMTHKAVDELWKKWQDSPTFYHDTPEYWQHTVRIENEEEKRN